MEYEDDAGGYEDILSPEDIMLEYEDYDTEFYTDQTWAILLGGVLVLGDIGVLLKIGIGIGYC